MHGQPMKTKLVTTLVAHNNSLGVVIWMTDILRISKSETRFCKGLKDRWEKMKPVKLLEELNEFEYWLKEFERQRKSLLGSPVTSSTDDELRSQKQQVHHSLDDFRLSLLWKYHSLRPFIESYSQCFTFVSETGQKPQETYEVLIEHGVIDFELIYQDLSQIKDKLGKYDPGARANLNGYNKSQ